MEKSTFSRNYRLFLRLLVEARKGVGTTQEQLAKRLGETQSFVSKCERGERRLDIVEVKEFCRALGISFPQFAADLNRILDKKRPTTR